MATRQDHIKSITLDSTVAFKLGEKMFSGKVKEITNEGYTVQTHNNSIYFISFEDVVWVKKGSRYPEGIYNALKQSAKIKEEEE